MRAIRNTIVVFEVVKHAFFKKGWKDEREEFAL